MALDNSLRVFIARAVNAEHAASFADIDLVRALHELGWLEEALAEEGADADPAYLALKIANARAAIEATRARLAAVAQPKREVA